MDQRIPYVCAFRGRRDSYQVPLALTANGRLDQFITDFWAGPLARTLPLPERWREKLATRREPDIPDAQVRCLWLTTLREHAQHRLGVSRAETYAVLDQHYGRAAAARARKTRANLLLYTPYAWEGFTARYAHQPRRLLFQFHPHSDYEERLLREDCAAYPEIAYSFAQETGHHLPALLRERTRSCWKHADGILCASTFTQRTLLEADAEPTRLALACYGSDNFLPPDDAIADDEAPSGFEVLFVGSGVQRKGLHHLLRAWEASTLPAESRLTLVCRVLDPGLCERVARTPRVRWLPGVAREELSRLYRRSTLFAMPSLVEGFGQVYLEALAHGCPVLGTANTCLPDLGTQADGIFLTGVANIDDLVYQLEDLSRRLPAELRWRRRARAVARIFTWSKFRASVIAQL